VNKKKKEGHGLVMGEVKYPVAQKMFSIRNMITHHFRTFVYISNETVF